MHYGRSDLEPLIVLDTDAAVARRLLIGELDPTIAIARDQVSASGPAETLLTALATTELEADR